MNYKKLAISALMSLLIIIVVVIGVFLTLVIHYMAAKSEYFRAVLGVSIFLGLWIAITCNYYKSMKKKKGKIKLHNIEYSSHEEKDNTKLSNLESKCKWWHKKRMQDMVGNYFYCPNCGYEDTDIFVAYSATYANGDFYYCPNCGKESSHYEIEE